MIIRQAQLESMEARMQLRYFETLRQSLRTHSPQLVAHMDDEALLRQIAAAVPVAQGFGVKTGEAILAFLGLWIIGGSRFVEEPTMQRYLHTGPGTPDERVHWMFRRVTQKLQAALGIADPNAEARS